ncbi:MAG TPA: hypothetical protein DHU96_26360 [Actinobacteria bacterium]|nr:hypothetical protein [Actinomycetota bacterium]
MEEPMAVMTKPAQRATAEPMAVMTKSAQRVTAQDAAALVRSGDWLDYGAVLAQPDAFDRALAQRAGELRNVNIRGCLSLRPRAVLEADPEREHFNFFNWHLGGYDRKLSDAGRQNYIPCNLGEIPDYYRRFIDPPDIMVVKTCPVDANRFFNFGPANLWHGAVASRAKIVIVETDPAVPYVHGIENGLHVSQVDFVVEGGGQPLPELPSPRNLACQRSAWSRCVSCGTRSRTIWASVQDRSRSASGPADRCPTCRD